MNPHNHSGHTSKPPWAWLPYQTILDFSGIIHTDAYQTPDLVIAYYQQTKHLIRIHISD